MTDIFNFSRFCQLVEKQWLEQRRGWVIAMLGMTGGIVITFGFALYFQNFDFFRMDGGQYVDYMVTLGIGGLILTSLAFAELSTQPRGIAYLMNPSSRFEKLLAAILFYVILFFVAFNLAYYAVDYIMVGIAQHGAHLRVLRGAMTQEAYERIQMLRFTGSRIADVGPVDPEVSLHLFQAFFAFQAAFLLGSVVFKRFSFLLSLLFLTAFIILLGLVTGQMYDWIMGRAGNFRMVDAHRGFQYVVAQGGQLHSVTFSGWGFDALVFIFHWCLGPFLLLVTYFRLKEKEV